MSNQQIFIIYTSEQKGILAAMDTIPFSSSSLNMSLSFWPFTHFHKGKKNSKWTVSKRSDASSTLLSHDQVHKSHTIHSISQSFQGQWLSYAVTLLLLPSKPIL